MFGGGVIFNKGGGSHYRRKMTPFQVALAYRPITDCELEGKNFCFNLEKVRYDEKKNTYHVLGGGFVQYKMDRSQLVHQIKQVCDIHFMTEQLRKNIDTLSEYDPSLKDTFGCKCCIIL